MRDVMGERIEIAANICIILFALVTASIMIKDRLSVPRAQASKPPAVTKSQPDTGTKLTLPEVDWSESNQTLLLVLSDKCRFCSDSAGFYRQLAEAAGQRRRTRLVAVFPLQARAPKQYLDELEVPIDEIRHVSLDDIGARGTPTLVLVDSVGVVKQSWVGRLNPDRESEVLNVVKCDTCD